MNKQLGKQLRDFDPVVFFIPAIIALLFLALYISMQSKSIYGGDSGELVMAAYTFGIAHPPGYPLYTLIGGLLARFIQFETVAWRVGLLSSIPMAISVAVVWLIVYRFTRHAAAAVVSSLSYGLLYPVWLYGIVPEVFGLYALMSSLFVYVFVTWTVGKRERTLYILAFLSGLSLTHHHLMILAVVAWLALMVRDHFSILEKIKWKLLSWFCVGVSPYLYAPVASLFGPFADSEHAATFTGFVQLVTRASYGTFRASANSTGGVFYGLTDVTTFLQFLYKDIGPVGIILSLFGLYMLWKQKKQLFTFMSVYLGLLVFYFFYAAFPVMSNFMIGTLERFFIVPYQMVCILLGIGLAFVVKQTPRVAPLIVLILFVFPFVQAKKTYHSLSSIRQDTTLERYADDILTSIPFGAVYAAQQDLTIGVIDYALLVEKKRPDILYLNYYLLNRPYYREQIKRRYPTLTVPEWEKNMTIGDYLSSFFELNKSHTVFTSDVTLASVPGVFVPRGLVYMYYPSVESVSSGSLILAKNEELWKGFSDPSRGALATYKHLLLSDVLEMYADHAIGLAQAFILAGSYSQGQTYIDYALAHEPDVRIERYVGYIDELLKQHECVASRNIVQKLKQKWGEDYIILEQYHKLKSACAPDDPDVNAMDEKYLNLNSVYDKPIQ